MQEFSIRVSWELRRYFVASDVYRRISSFQTCNQRWIQEATKLRQEAIPSPAKSEGKLALLDGQGKCLLQRDQSTGDRDKGSADQKLQRFAATTPPVGQHGLSSLLSEENNDEKRNRACQGEREDIMVLNRVGVLYWTVETNGKGIEYMRGTKRAEENKKNRLRQMDMKRRINCEECKRNLQSFYCLFFSL